MPSPPHEVDVDVVAIGTVPQERVDLMIGILVRAQPKSAHRNAPDAPFIDVGTRHQVPTLPTRGSCDHRSECRQTIAVRH
jgi:hypothetical protein